MKSTRTDAWEAALATIETLRANGHIALLAGGCVRDRLLGTVPKDYDIATDATPQRVKELFRRSRQVGAKFGVMLIRKYGHDIEVATFRSDGPYSDGRHPDAVSFGTDKEDAFRRDFTINGLFLDPVDDRVIDYVGGRSDLEAGIIRTIGDPDRRFNEDHLRMLRAVRFAARLAFAIEPATFDAIKKLSPHLVEISVERIWMELELILTDPSRKLGWSLLVETGLCNYLAPSWDHRHAEDSNIRVHLEALPPHRVDASLALAAVLQLRQPEEVMRICRALRLSNKLSDDTVWLVRSLPLLRDDRSLELADLKLLMVQEPWPVLLELLRVNLVATQADVAVYERVRARAANVDPTEVAPPPLLSGDDLSGCGLDPGPRMGEILRVVYRQQLNGSITTRREALVEAQRLVAG